MRRLIGAILFSVLLTSCASPSPTPAPITETASTPPPLTLAADAPKGADLVFVEFFAVT